MKAEERFRAVHPCEVCGEFVDTQLVKVEIADVTIRGWLCLPHAAEVRGMVTP